MLVGFGSGYYHLAPGNEQLLWDRLAMMLAFMAWFADIVAERVSLRWGLRLLPLLIAAGLGSAVYWSRSEARWMGDLGDYPVFALTGGLVSGHTIKHVIAALAVGVWRCMCGGAVFYCEDGIVKTAL